MHEIDSQCADNFKGGLRQALGLTMLGSRKAKRAIGTIAACLLPCMLRPVTTS